jgi:hypothetical protein
MTKPITEEEVKPITDAEIDIFMCRLQGAIWEENREKIAEIIEEIKARKKEIELYNEKKYGAIK